MKIGKKMNDELNKQLNKEVSSAYIYLGMAVYFDDLNLKGFAGWMKKQAGEEMKHAMKIYGFVNDREGAITLGAVPAAGTLFKSPSDAVDQAYKHEQFITDAIHKLVDVAQKEKDLATENFLSWFITEQVEEEAQTRDILDKLKLVGDTKGALFQLDAVLGQRKD